MKIYSAAEIGETNGTYFIYGAPGTGKTSALKYLPGKTLVLDIDRTSKVLRGCSNIDILEIDNIKTYSHWSDTLKELGENYVGVYDNIAVDTISELERCILSDLGRAGKNKGVPSQGDYQYMQFKLVDSLRYLKNMKANIILTAWEITDSYTDSGGAQYNRSYPQISAKILNNICGLCDVVGRLIVKEDGTRGFCLTATNSIFAKNQRDDRKGCLQSELMINEPTPVSD